MTETNTRTVVAGKGIGLIGPLQVEILPDGRRARLLQPFRVRLRELGERVIEVPQGFETDFASVPRFFWRGVPPWGRYSPAAVVHDYLYSTGKVSREEADRAFLTLMLQMLLSQRAARSSAKTSALWTAIGSLIVAVLVGMGSAALMWWSSHP